MRHLAGLPVRPAHEELHGQVVHAAHASDADRVQVLLLRLVPTLLQAALADMWKGAEPGLRRGIGWHDGYRSRYDGVVHRELGWGRDGTARMAGGCAASA